MIRLRAIIVVEYESLAEDSTPLREAIASEQRDVDGHLLEARELLSSGDLVGITIEATT